METTQTVLKKNEQLISTDDLIAYEKYSNGAIELHRDYVVIYTNLLPFKNCVRGRISHIIPLNNIREFAFKGIGWFDGVLYFSYKNGSRAKRYNISLWWIWKRLKFNNSLTPIFDYIAKYTINSSRTDSYRKVETVKEIKERGCCPVCGQPVNQNQKFCGFCGSKVGQ